MKYAEFLNKKAVSIPCFGFAFDKKDMNKALFDWQKDVVCWALKKGRAALFEDCGLGKTIQQLEWSRIISLYTDQPVMIIAPLAVAKQTKREGQKFGYEVNICRSQNDISAGINITNYEMLGRFDLSTFSGIVLDESSILKQYAGKFRNQIIENCSNIPFKLSCTATPAPNDYMEFGNQAEFLGVMKRNEMLAEFFVHDGSDTSKWRLKGHAYNNFWTWLTSWAAVITTPADLGYDSTGYELPELNIKFVTVKSDGEIASTLSERREARRKSLSERCAAARRIIDAEPLEQWLIWCDLNDESEHLKKIIPNSREVRGSYDIRRKEIRLEAFSEGLISRMITKPSIAGFGLNWQSCHNMIFVGLSDSYEQLYQAIRRCWRFGQKNDVNVYIVTSEAESSVRENIERKDKQCTEFINEMVTHTKEILEKDIKATARITDAYEPKIEMWLPPWMKKGGYTV